MSEKREAIAVLEAWMNEEDERKTSKSSDERSNERRNNKSDRESERHHETKN